MKQTQPSLRATLETEVGRRSSRPAIRTLSRLVGMLTGMLMIVLQTRVTDVSGQSLPKMKRARPPSWEKLPEGIFFADPFAEGLQGPRPATLNRDASTPAEGRQADADGRAKTEGTTAPWSQLISASTLEDEIKRIERLAGSATVNEGQFKGRGYPIIRQQFGIAAMLFAIIEQYEAPNVRWQAAANTMWQRLARASANAKVGTVPAYRDAQLRHQELFDLIRGSQPEPLATVDLTWAEVIDRGVIMGRLKLAVDQTLAEAVANPKNFGNQTDTIVREAELAAAIGHVLRQPSMDDATDDEYRAFAQMMQTAAQQMVAAAKQADYGAGRVAHDQLKASCVNCHETYR